MSDSNHAASIAFTQLELRGFKLFVAPVSVPLHDLGLVLVQGRNLVSASADSNGVCKSALVSDAIPWILHDRTVRKERGDQVAYRFNDALCAGRLHVVVDRVAGRITRTRRPASLTVEHGTITREAERAQAWIDAHFWGWATYCNAAIYGQRASQFASADSDVQRKVLEEVLDLNFAGALERAKAWRKALEAERAEVERWTLSEETRVAVLRERADELRPLVDAWSDEHRTRLTEARRQLADFRTLAAARDETLRVAKRELKITKVAEAGVRAYERWHHDAAIHADLVTKAAAALRAAETAQQKFAGRLGGLVTNKRCPTCLQPTTDSDALRARFQPERDAMQHSVEKARRALTTAETAQTDHAATKPPVMQRLDWVRDVAAREMAVSVATSARMYTQEGVDGASIRVHDIESETCAARDELTNVERVLHTTTDALATSVKRLVRIEHTCRVAEYWTRAFSPQGIPNLVLESEEATIQARLDIHLAALTRGEARVELRALERLKNGGVRERVNVSAAWQWGGGTLNSNSDGQDRRVNLAVFAALQDLAELRSARPFPVKVFDEPCDKLDALGKALFIEWVRAQAATRSTTFFVTHDADVLGQVQPDAVWTVELGVDGARVLLGE